MDTRFLLDIGIVVFSAGISWGISTWRIERLEKDRESDSERQDQEFKNLWGQVEMLRKRAHDQTKELYDHNQGSSDYRLSIEKQFGEVNVKLADTKGDYKNILAALNRLEGEIKSLRGDH